MRSSARDSPISRGSRTVPPSTSGTPNRRQKTPITADRSTTRRSHHSANSSPPATAWPEIAATTGFESNIRVGPMGPSPSGATRFPSPVDSALRSAPAQNVPPSPHSTATAAFGSSSKALNASLRASAVGRSTAFLRSGRDSITVQISPVFSTRTDMAFKGTGFTKKSLDNSQFLRSSPTE